MKVNAKKQNENMMKTMQKKLQYVDKHLKKWKDAEIGWTPF
jgi:hypothetical protein